jgi:hypothetical protein
VRSCSTCAFCQNMRQVAPEDDVWGPGGHLIASSRTRHMGKPLDSMTPGAVRLAARFASMSMHG